MGKFKEQSIDQMFHPSTARFNGPDYVPERDNTRLTGQIKDVFNCMKDGNWRTLEEIQKATRHPQTSISAQLRHLRKERFGSHVINKHHIGGGLYKYRLVVNNKAA